MASSAAFNDGVASMAQEISSFDVFLKRGDAHAYGYYIFNLKRGYFLGCFFFRKTNLRLSSDFLRQKPCFSAPHPGSINVNSSPPYLTGVQP